MKMPMLHESVLFLCRPKIWFVGMRSRGARKLEHIGGMKSFSIHSIVKLGMV